jgi:hypothetical protein
MGGASEGNKAEQEKLIRLRNVLIRHLNKGELRTLCFDLGVDYEILPDQNKADMARELVAYLDHYDRIPDLVASGKKRRPDVAWEETLAKTEEAIDRNLIRSFVLRSLNRANDRDIEEFLEEEFNQGLREGTWLFLFDSFDELPEVLSSIEADEMIRSYADAISDFLGGMNQCRGIIASRQFRGPGQLGWPRFRILPLSEERSSELVHKAELKAELERELVGQLGMAGHEIRSMVSNPMFLGLLCEYMRTGNSFPENAQSVFETYIGTRLTRDKERLWRRFQLEPTNVRAAAESLAFCMAADPGLGLSPTRQDLEDATVRLGLRIGGLFDTLLDALEYIKLARSETATTPGESKPFTFSHRRFQEYFATCVVLREPDRVSPRQLLTDARWRETAIVMCQTQPLEVLSPIIEEARRLLTEIVDSTPGLIDEPLEYVRALESEEKEDTEKEKPLPKPFTWPSGVLHILGLLQSGFGSRLDELPDDIRMAAGRLILSASSTGIRSDKKWSLEVAGIVPSSILLWLLRDAFASQSQWLREVAYRQAARLGEVPADITSEIRRALVDLFASHRLRRERLATRAHLARLDGSEHFVSILRLLLSLPFVDLGIHIVELLSVLGLCIWAPSLMPLGGLALATFLLVSSHLSLRRLPRFLMSPRSADIGRMASALLVFYVRVFFVPGLLVFLLLQNVRDEASASATAEDPFFIASFWLVLLWFPLALWAPYALLSARTGQFTHPFWWLLMPAWPFLYLARNVKKSIAGASTWLGKRWRSIVALSPIMVIFVGCINTVRITSSHRAT